VPEVRIRTDDLPITSRIETFQLDPPRTILAAQVRDRFHPVPSRRAWSQRLGCQTGCQVACVGVSKSLLWFGALSIRSRSMLVARPASSVCVRWVVSSGSKLQVRPAARPPCHSTWATARSQYSSHRASTQAARQCVDSHCTRASTFPCFSRRVASAAGRDWPVALATGGCEARPGPTDLAGRVRAGTSTGKRGAPRGHDHDGGWHGDLLQGLGKRSARRVQPWLAPVGR